MVISDKEKADEYKRTLTYVLANLSYRKIRPETCATDDNLIKYIESILLEKGMRSAVKISRDIKKSHNFYKKHNENKP